MFASSVEKKYQLQFFNGEVLYPITFLIPSYFYLHGGLYLPFLVGCIWLIDFLKMYVKSKIKS